MRRRLSFFALLVAVFVASATFSKDVMANAYIDCNSNNSTRKACLECANDPGCWNGNDNNRKGALWISSEPMYSSSAGNATVTVTNPAASTAHFYVYGAYILGQVWREGNGFGVGWHQSGGLQPASYIRVSNDASSENYVTGYWNSPKNDPAVTIQQDQMLRASFPGELGGGSANGTLDINQVRSTWSSRASGGWDIYNKTLYIFRCAGWAYEQDGLDWKDSNCWADASSVEVKIKAERIEDLKITPTVSLSGMAYIGETAPQPQEGWSAAVQTLIGDERKRYNNVKSLDSINNNLKTKKIEKETKLITFYVSHNGGGLGAKENFYSGNDPTQEVCRQFGASNCNMGRQILNQDSYVGYKFCAVTAARIGVREVSTGNISWESWSASAAACIPIAKKTNLGVAGGGIYASGEVSTAVERKTSSTMFGSWVEGLLVTGKDKVLGGDTKGLSSGGGLYGGLSSGEQLSNTSKYSPETTGNTTAKSTRNYIEGADIEDSQAFVNQVKAIILEDNYQVSDKMEIIPTNYITASIYNTVTDPNEYKQKIIYSNGDLTIDNSVTRIDAWIIVDGNLDTCSNGTVTGKVGTSMDANACNNQLIINGLVYADSITLDRTSGGTGADMAEIINLTPMSYVWAYNQASSTNANPTTVYIRELAPRV